MSEVANQEHVKILRQGVALWNQWREENPRVYPDLTEADFQGSDLSEANFSKTNLYCANLSNARLVRASFDNTYASWALFVNANLSEAWLHFTNLVEADLQGADVTRASMWGAILAGNDLCKVTGLETVDHSGPSYVGADTLLRSNGKIPDVFLRGCGLPDDFISYVPSFGGSAFDFYSCFISHNKADKQFARQLHDRLQGRGIRCWLDEKQLNPGDDLYHEIDRGIRVWDKVLLCASKDSLTSAWVDDEITIALEKEKELLKSTQQKLLKIIPLDLDGFMFSGDWQSGYRAMIRKRVAADFTTWKTDADEFERQLERVVRALRTDGGKLPEPPSKLK